MPVRAVFRGAITCGSGLGDDPLVYIRDAPYDHVVRSGNPALQILVADFLLKLSECLLAIACCAWRPAAEHNLVAQFLDRNARAKDPTLRIECCLRSVLEGSRVFHLDRDIVAYPARSGYDLVGIDNRRAGYAITSHLLEAGCQRIAFVARPGSAPTVDARIAGYREAMLNSRTDWTPDLVCRIDPLGKDAVRTLLDRLKPDGIICANDFTAAGEYGSSGVPRIGRYTYSIPSSLTSAASSNGTRAISGGLRRLTTVVTP